jgi:hypothetical protein
MDYTPLLGLEDLESVFRTERGSTYAHHGDATTTRNRSSAKHADKTEGMQSRSGRTVFMSPKDVNVLGGYFQNPDMATKFMPVLDENGKPTGRAALTLLEDYGPKKAGTVLYESTYQTKPSVGSNPVEIYRSESKIGDPGRGIHFGNKITEVHQKPQSGGSGEGRSISGAGGVSINKRAMGESVNPFAINKLYSAGGNVDKAIEGNWKYI